MKQLRPHQETAINLLRESMKAKKRRPMLQLDSMALPWLHVGMEKWKAVPGYEGYYEVSDLGNVRSLDRVIVQENRWGSFTKRRLRGSNVAQVILEPTPGYWRSTVGLSKGGYTKTRLVHHLVAEAFIGPRPVGHEVAHCDGNSLNNKLANLRYALPVDNTRDKFGHGTMLRGAAIGNSKLTEKQAREIIALKGLEKLRVTASKYNVAESAISRIQNGVRWGWLHEKP